ncbi:MAG: PrsW family glutamic-type intramembrane protease [Patescibacteria group bacterium]
MLDSFFSFDPSHLLISLLGGIVPALLWLGFWLREDTLHPEPRRIIFWTFCAGAVAALVSLPLEAIAYSFTDVKIVLFLAVAVIEETAKYIAAKKAALGKATYDEPVDALIYLITAALGFAALENTLFIASSLAGKGLVTALIVGETRFVGSTLLHILASSIIGVSLALPFFHNAKEKKRDFRIGLILAILLHTLFNFSIIQEGTHSLFLTFFSVWVLVVLLLLIFEKVKRIQS